ncbi:alpha/beta fold hydrolase [Empedobacter brevis]|uniref:alpha/beta fold hydrolase n=1 Tax=Empedobacter brevis TaxID=247 RepID=UPI0039AEA68A
MKNSPNWLDKEEYPFISKFMKVDGQNIHYIDEGKGNVLLFIHGTLSWSFEYRKLIKSLSKTHRCIAYDHIGFGLSDKPQEYDYSIKNI